MSATEDMVTRPTVVEGMAGAGTATTTMIVVRHGQSLLNKHKHTPGSGGAATAQAEWLCDASLSPDGEDQAARAGAYIASTPSLSPSGISLIACAPLARSIQTALGVADALGGEGVEVHVNPELREATKGRPIGRKVEVLEAEFGDPRLVWDQCHVQGDGWTEGVESGEEAEARAGRVREYVAEMGAIHPVWVLIGHGNLFKKITALDLKIINGEVRSIVWDGESPPVLSPRLFSLPSAINPPKDVSEAPKEAPKEEEASLEDLARLLSSQINTSSWIEDNPATGPTLLEIAQSHSPSSQ